MAICNPTGLAARFVVAATLLFVSATQTSLSSAEGSAPSSGSGIQGPDDRKPLETVEGPWSSVGRLEVQSKTGPGRVSICTGTLVWDDLVLTNAHCVLEPGGGKLRQETVWFKAGLRGSQALARARVVRAWLGTRDPDRDRRRDWAILEISEPIGKTLGWLDLIPNEETAGGIGQRPVTFVAYATDFLSGVFPSIQRDCALLGLDLRRGYLRHDCDMNTGSSGAPLLTTHGAAMRIAGINAAYIRPGGVAASFNGVLFAHPPNVAVNVDLFRETLATLRGAGRPST